MRKTKENKSAKRIDIINLIIGFAGVLLGLFIGIYTVRSSEKIAQKSGAFDKPKAQLYLSNFAPLPNEETYLYYGCSFRDSSIIIGKLPTAVKNIGEKTIENLSVTFRYPKELQRRLLENGEMVTGGSYEHREISKDVNEMGDFEYATFRLQRLNPNQVIELGEPIFLFETKVQDTVNVKNVSIGYELNYAIKLTITISGSDIITQDYAINLQVFDSNNMSELEQNVYNSVLEKARRIREKISFWNYATLLTTNQIKHAVLVYPLLDTLKTNFGTLYQSGDKNNKIRLVTYEPFSLSLLF